MQHALIDADGSVVAALDASPYADSVAATAAWAAARLQVPLEFIHCLDRAGGAPVSDLSGSLELGAQEDLLSELAAVDEQRAKLAQRRGRALLEQLSATVLASLGVEARIRQRHGALVDTLLDLEAGTRLFVIGKRGEHADFAKGHLGSNLERVMRAVHRPVLIAARAHAEIKRFAIAFDGSATTRTCVEMVALSPLLRGLECHVLSVGADADSRRQHVDWATQRLAEAGIAATATIRSGEPDVAIGSYVDDNAIDLLVMGAYGHSRIRSMIVGSTTTQLLRLCHIPVLMLR